MLFYCLLCFNLDGNCQSLKNFLTSQCITINTMYYNNCIKILLVLSSIVVVAKAIRCYQCSSDTDPKNEDNCGAYEKFQKDRYVAVECNSDESVTPGTFCMKVTQQSPRGFIWDGRWRQVIRRCASVAETGVTGVCNWGVRENGIYWEECYCSEDGCNSSSSFSSSLPLIFVLSIFLLLYRVH